MSLDEKIKTNRQSNKKSDRQTDRQADRQIDRQTDRQTDKQTGRQLRVDKEVSIYIYIQYAKTTDSISILV